MFIVVLLIGKPSNLICYFLYVILFLIKWSWWYVILSIITKMQCKGEPKNGQAPDTAKKFSLQADQYQIFYAFDTGLLTNLLFVHLRCSAYHCSVLVAVQK